VCDITPNLAAEMDPSLFSQMFKAFLGLPDHKRPKDDEEVESHLQRRDGTEAELYKVFTDPLEMNRFFEQQMDEMIRNFGQGLFGGSLRSGPSLGPWGGRLEPLPGVEEECEVRPDHVREFMLKEGDVGKEKVDSDLDTISDKELERLLGPRGGRMIKQGELFKQKSEFANGAASIYDQQSQMNWGEPRSWSLGQSYSSTTVRKEDGTVETTRTMRSNDGKEKVTVSVQDPSGSIRTEERRAEGHGDGQENIWRKVPLGGMEVPGHREEMLAPPRDKLYSDLWDKFFK